MMDEGGRWLIAESRYVGALLAWYEAVNVYGLNSVEAINALGNVKDCDAALDCVVSTQTS